MSGKFNLNGNTYLNNIEKKFQEDKRTVTSFLSPPDLDVENDLELDEFKKDTEQESQASDKDEKAKSEKEDPSIILHRKEARSKRVNILFTPTVLAKIDEQTKDLNISRSDFINQLVDFYFSHLE